MIEQLLVCLVSWMVLKEFLWIMLVGLWLYSDHMHLCRRVASPASPASPTKQK